ncbi:MAG: gamma-glutamyltransferase [Spirochaetae bacterium HGW-Spirochaetae-3]|jgi:gamma-glutamyltranspeptidase/glutathione hydrolase|nr:MAG: gamma-glutamyltransferase [Spirochaetae bacterium HGW-Spirochaetae-3]
MKKVIIASLLIAVTAVVVTSQNPVNLYGRAAQGAKGVVAAAKPEASQVGVDILKKGGNAVDAAVATAFALGVLEPNASGVGGGGFMVIKLVNMKEAVVIDFRESAPAASTPDMFKYGEDGKVIGNASVVGGLASGVPGEVAGLLYALDNYGSKKIKRDKIIAPAIEWAERGIPVTVNLASIIQDNLGKINTFPADAAIYTKDGLPYELGDTIKNPDYAATLKAIAKGGADAIYKGEMAEKIAKAVRDAGGIMTAQDLASYQVKVRKPITGTYRGYSLISTPPASSGGTIIVEILNILENFDLATYGDGTPETDHLWIEALRLAFADRGKYMADADFVKVPLAGLTSKDYAKTLAAKISMDKAMGSASADDPTKYESGSTTSFAVMDKAGNMVAVTKSINYFFGSGVVVPGTGIIMNNHMDDFALKPGHVQSIEPGKRPLSSMSPTLVLDPDGKPFMAVGSPGATRIIEAVAQTISNVVDHGMTIQQAIMAPRLFAMASGAVQLEGRTSVNTVKKLEALGHTVNVRADWDAYFGGVHAVVYDRAAKMLEGGADPRRDGQAVGF